MKMKSKNIRNIRYLSLIAKIVILIKLLNILTREDDHGTIQRRRVRWRGWDGLSEDGIAFSLRHDDHLKRIYSRSSFSWKKKKMKKAVANFHPTELELSSDMESMDWSVSS